VIGIPETSGIISNNDNEKIINRIKVFTPKGEK